MEQRRNLDRALKNAGVTVLYQGRDLKVRWSRNVPSSWSARPVTGLSDPEFLPAGEADRILAVKTAVLDGRNGERTELHIPTPAGGVWFDVWIDTDLDEDGVVAGVLTTAVETTGHKQREQTLKALLREVSHRSKNLLAIIQSIAGQTGRYSESIESFLARFTGRLQSLASSQDLVTSSNWRGAMLGELAMSQVGRYADPRLALRVSGMNPYLNPNAAMHVGLALHELAVNSVSYGALSLPGGTVQLAAKPQRLPDGAGAVRIEWREAVPAASPAAAEKRFGSVALERVVPASLGGSSELRIADGWLTYGLVVPASNFEL